MKTWTLRIRDVDKSIFERIKKGEKTVETRALNDDEPEKAYFGHIMAGDKVIFICDDKMIKKTVKSVRIYKDYNEYLDSEDLENIHGRGATKESARELHFSFPLYKDRLEKYGIVAFDME